MLVGRDPELAAVERLLQQAEGGTGEVLVIGGPEGSGKTALADAAVERARRRAFEVVRSLPSPRPSRPLRRVPGRHWSMAGAR
ncbi:MAG: ATP-binding protein [Acidimicrobiales bacterium]